MILDFSVGYAIRGPHVNLDGLKLIVKQQLLVEADDVNTLGGSVHTVEPKGSQPPERGGRAQGVIPEARTNNPYSHHSFGQLRVEPQDSCGRGLAYSYQY